MTDALRDFLAKARANTTSSTAATSNDDGPATDGALALATRLARIEPALSSLDELERRHERAPEPWGLAALRGRLVELSARGASATLTTAIGLAIEAQREGEPVAWVVPWGGGSTPPGTFYPPDAADAGLDLAALVVVRAPSAVAAARASERLLRSGAFGLLVLDFGAGAVDVPMTHQGRLVTLAQAHDAAIVCLTDKPDDSASLGSLVSLRAEALRLRTPDGPTPFEVKVRALKDKRRGPGWLRTRAVRGPAGM